MEKLHTYINYFFTRLLRSLLCLMKPLYLWVPLLNRIFYDFRVESLVASIHDYRDECKNNLES
jgi:hypothetical protein